MSSPMFTPFIINTPSMIKSRSGGKKQQPPRRTVDHGVPGQPQQAEPLIDNRPRRPKACVGDGELLRMPPTTNGGPTTTSTPGTVTSTNGEQRPVFRLIRSSTGATATPTTAAIPTTAGVKRRLNSTSSPVVTAAALPRPADTATPPKRILIRKAPQSSISSHHHQQGGSVHPEPSSSNAYAGMSQYYHGENGSLGHVVVADGAGNESDSQHDEIIDVMGGLEETLEVDRKPPVHIGSPRVRIHRPRYEDELDEETRNDPQSAAMAHAYNELASCLKRPTLSGSPNGDALIEVMNAAAVALREGRKQNEQLTKKAEIYSSKVKQMDSLLMDRNQRLKKLVSDNIRAGARVRRMESEIGVDRVKELFGTEQLQLQ